MKRVIGALLILISSLAPYVALAAYGLSTSGHLVVASDQWFSAADSTSLSVTGDLTIECWINANSWPAAGISVPIVMKGNDTTTDPEYRFFFITGTNSAKLQVTLYADNTNTNASQAVGTHNFNGDTGKWIYVATTWAHGVGNAPILYYDINGAGLTVDTNSSSATNAASMFDSTTGLGIGATFAGTNDGVNFKAFDGNISLCRVWGAVLSSATLAAQECTVFGSAQTNMKAEWSLNNVLTDASGNSNTLTNHNVATFTSSLPSFCTNPPSTFNPWQFFPF